MIRYYKALLMYQGLKIADSKLSIRAAANIKDTEVTSSVFSLGIWGGFSNLR